MGCVRFVKSLLLTWTFLLLLSAGLQAQEMQSAAPAPLPSGPVPPPPPVSAEELLRPRVKALPVEQVAPGIFRMGEIEINKKAGSLSFPAQVNMDKGLLEYLLVRIGGKLHESLLRTQVEPYHLQIAFLLLGFEATATPIQFQGAPEKPQGKSVELSISYRDKAGQMKEVKAEEWLANKAAEELRPAGKINWVFTGSVVANGRFLAQNEGSIIATYHDPIAMIDNASPGGENDKIWFVRQGIVPAPGTPVTVTVKAVK